MSVPSILACQESKTPDATTDEPKRQQANPHKAEGLFRWRKHVISKSTRLQSIQRRIANGYQQAGGPIWRKEVNFPVRRSWLLSLILSSALLQANTAVKAEIRKVTFSYSAVSMTWFPVKVAVEKGFFRNEGLEPQLIQMNGNVATVALANGHIEFSLNISPVLNGAIQGLGTKLVAALNSRPLFSLVVRSEIKSPADLKGKVFAVSSFGNTQAILTEKHLQHLGLRKGEYQLLAMGATPARMAALEKNIAQGSLMPLPTNVQMENKGYRLLGNTAEIVTNPIAGLGVHEDRIKRDPDLIKRTIRASLRSLQLLQANPTETVKILMDWTRASEKDALRSLDLAKPGFSKNGLLTDDDLSIEWSFIQQQTKKTNVPVSIAHDMTLLKEVQRELGM
jgi:ABC-type nitrate/sulfonate/bicarbonate transport system substrate-binding protein